MGVLQKYTEKAVDYDIDQYFLDQLRELPSVISYDIAKQIDKNFEDLPQKTGWSQAIAGVSTKLDEDFYFVIDYLYQPNEIPIFLELDEIELNEYLDYILEHKSFKHYDTNRNTEFRFP